MMTAQELPEISRIRSEGIIMQATAALFSPEAELCSMTKSPVEGLGMKSLMENIGAVDIKTWLHSDASVALSVAERRCVEWLRRIITNLFWTRHKNFVWQVMFMNWEGQWSFAGTITTTELPEKKHTCQGLRLKSQRADHPSCLRNVRRPFDDDHEKRPLRRDGCMWPCAEASVLYITSHEPEVRDGWSVLNLLKEADSSTRGCRRHRSKSGRHERWHQEFTSFHRLKMWFDKNEGVFTPDLRNIMTDVQFKTFQRSTDRHVAPPNYVLTCWQDDEWTQASPTVNIHILPRSTDNVTCYQDVVEARSHHRIVGVGFVHKTDTDDCWGDQLVWLFFPNLHKLLAKVKWDWFLMRRLELCNFDARKHCG